MNAPLKASASKLNPSRARKALRLGASCLLAFSAWGSIANAADTYKTVPVPELSRQERSLASDFNRAKAPASAEAEAALKKQVVYYVARLTQPDDILNYTQFRKNLELLLSERNQTPQARAVVVNELVKYTGGIATRSDYSPAARINCAAILANLDEQPENPREGRPPLPSKAAFNFLKKMASDPASPDAVKAVAMSGLERQMRVYWNTAVFDEAKKTELQSIATGVIASSAKSALDETSHAWLVRRGYDMLAAVKSPIAVDVAIAHLSEPAMLPSIRLSSLAYLSELDPSSFAPDKQKGYLIGLAHFTRSQLVDWYEYEEDVIKRDTSAAGGGGFGGGMMGSGDGDGEEGGGGMSDYSSYMSGGGGGKGGGGPGGGMMSGGGAGSNAKPIDTQDWKTRKSRRLLNVVSQQIHISLDGKPLAEQRARVNKPLTTLADGQLLTQVQELVTLVEAFQTSVNDAAKVRDINTLLTASKLPIEDIMDFVLEIPGFTDRYPELAAEDDKLEVVPDAPVIADEEPESEDPAEGSDATGDAGDASEDGGN